MKFAKAALATAACAAVFTGVSTSPAAAAIPYHYTTGNNSGAAGYSNGSVTFHNQSVQISGTVKSNTTGCVRVVFQILTGSWAEGEERTACGRGAGTSKDFGFTTPSVVGGYTEVYVRLVTVTSDGREDRLIDDQTITRD